MCLCLFYSIKIKSNKDKKELYLEQAGGFTMQSYGVNVTTVEIQQQNPVF